MTTRVCTALLVALLMQAPLMLSAQWTQLVSPTDTSIITFLDHDGVLLVGAADGLYRTSDGGITWNHVIEEMSNNSKHAVPSLTIFGEHLFAAGGKGLYRSSDAGQTWEQVFQSSTRMWFVQGLGDTLFASLINSGMYMSTDTGTTWSRLEGQAFAIPPPTKLLPYDGYLYAATWGGVRRAGDQDGDLTVFAVRMGGITTSVSWIGVVDSDLVAASSEGLYRWNKTQGLDWKPMSLHGKNVRDVEMSGDMMMAGTLNGVYLSRDKGVTWTPISEGLTDSMVMTLGVHNGVLYAGTLSGGIWKLSLSDIPSSVEEGIVPHPIFSRLHITPNPASERIIAHFTLQRPAPVTVTIFDALGHIVSQPLVETLRDAGDQEIMLSVEGLVPSVYLCSVKAGGIEHSTRVVVAR